MAPRRGHEGRGSAAPEKGALLQRDAQDAYVASSAGSHATNQDGNGALVRLLWTGHAEVVSSGFGMPSAAASRTPDDRGPDDRGPAVRCIFRDTALFAALFTMVRLALLLTGMGTGSLP